MNSQVVQVIHDSAIPAMAKVIPIDLSFQKFESDELVRGFCGWKLEFFFETYLTMYEQTFVFSFTMI